MTTEKLLKRTDPPRADDTAPPRPNTTRRHFVVSALSGATAALIGACGGASENTDANNAGSSGDGNNTGGGAGTGGSAGTGGASGSAGSGGSGGGACTVYPEETEGPFYLDI